MSSCFLRLLFGDSAIDNFASVLEEVKWCFAQPYQPEPCLWFAYGIENAAFLQSCGIEPILMDSESFCRFGSDAPERAHHHATIRYNSSCWRMKYPCIRYALERFSECVYLDLDTVLTEPLPADFWERMGQGACFQATLQSNHRKRSSWRMKQTWPGKGPVDEDSRKTPAGAVLYFRGLDPIDRLLRLYAERPFEFDLHILSRLTDELMGGWKGWHRYKELGFEPYCHSLGKFENRQLFKPPEQRLFLTHWRKPRLRGYGPSETPYMLAKEFPEKKAE